MAINRYSTPVGPAQFKPMSLQELSFAPAALRQRQDIAEQQLAALEEGITGYDQSDPLIKNTLDKYSSELESATSKLTDEGFNKETSRNLINLKRAYKQNIEPINQFLNSKKEALKRFQMDRSRLGANFIPTKNVASVSYSDYLQDPGALAYTPINKADVVTASSNVFKNLAKSIVDPEQASKWRSILGGQYFEQVQQHGFRSPEEVMNFIQNTDEGQTMVRQIYSSMPELANIDPRTATNAIVQGAYSAIGSTSMQRLANRGFDTKGKASGYPASRVKQVGAVQFPAIGVEGSDARNKALDRLAIQKAREAGLTNVNSYSDLKNLAKVKKSIKGEEDTSLPFSAPFKFGRTAEEKKALSVLDDLEVSIDKAEPINVPKKSISELAIARGKDVNEAENLRGAIAERVNVDKNLFKGIDTKEQEAFDKIKTIKDVPDFSYDYRYGFGFKIIGEDEDGERVDSYVYLPERARDLEGRFVDFLKQLDPTILLEYRKRVNSGIFDK